MYAIFNEITKDLLRIQKNNIINTNEIALEIGIDIQWQIVIRRDGDILDIEKKDLKNKDIILKKYWEIESIEIIRKGKRKTIKEKDLLSDDKIEQKNYKKNSIDNITGYRVCRNGTDLQIEMRDKLADDIIVREFEKERIYINNQNEFSIRSDADLLKKYLLKIMQLYKNNLKTIDIIDNVYLDKINNMQTQVNGISSLEEAKELYKNVLSGAIN